MAMHITPEFLDDERHEADIMLMWHEVMRLGKQAHGRHHADARNKLVLDCANAGMRSDFAGRIASGIRSQYA